MVPILQQHFAIQRRSQWERLFVIAGTACIALSLLASLALHLVIGGLNDNEESEDILFGSVYVNEPAQREIYKKQRRKIKKQHNTADVSRHGGGAPPQQRHHKRTTTTRKSPSEISAFIKGLRVPEPQHHPSVPYDIHNCPAVPPRHYPYAWDAVDVLSHWNVDNTTIPTVIHQSLCIFDWENEQERIQTYRTAEVPFVFRNHPETQATTVRWNTPGYIKSLLGSEPQRNEHSKNNHLMFWRLPRSRRREAENLELPTENVELTFPEWEKKAKAIEDLPDEEQIHQDHYYFRLNAGADVNEYMYDELPFFRIDPPGDFMVEPQSARGINCRFGMKGSIAEAHFDPTRNFLVVLKGQRRYVLAHPSQCPRLHLYPSDHPSGRHSSVHWGTEYEKLAGAMLLDVLLQPSDTLYLPTSWFHFIVSLNMNYQCNARSGMTHENDHFITDCGFSVPKK